MLRAGCHDEHVGDQRREQRDPPRVAAQQTLGLLHHPVEPAGGLHEGHRGDDGEDHAEHGGGWRSRWHAEAEYEQRQSNPGHATQADAAESRSDEDTPEQDRQLEPHQRGVHHRPLLYMPVGLHSTPAAV